MKKLSTYLFLILFSFQVPSWADDISDFQIEGMSIGDSLLDYASKEKIKNSKKTYYPKSKRFYQIILEGDYNDYDNVNIHVKKDDKKYLIAAIAGSKFFPNNLKECKKMKDKVVKEVSYVLQKSEDDSYEFTYPDGKSIAYITDFNFSRGSIRIFCINWSRATEKKEKFTDNLSINISTRIISDWLEEAY